MPNQAGFIESVSKGEPLAVAAKAGGAPLQDVVGWFNDLEFQRLALNLNIDILVLRERVINEAGATERLAVAAAEKPQAPERIGIMSPLHFTTGELEKQLAELRAGGGAIAR